MKQYPNGLIPASEINRFLRKQLVKHGYTPTLFAEGVGIPAKLFLEWWNGRGMIRPDELEKICNHLGVKDIYDGLPESFTHRLRDNEEITEEEPFELKCLAADVNDLNSYSPGACGVKCNEPEMRDESGDCGCDYIGHTRDCPWYCGGKGELFGFTKKPQDKRDGMDQGDAHR